uniref:E3 ubiquitin-protein ligase n=1 Tax=Oryza punctata TaxID=4537 RepID=A0A0E0LAX7_ORYPU
MAKFSLDDADDDPPVATGREKRKRDDGPADGEVEPPGARDSAVAGREPAEAEAADRRGPVEEMADGEVEGGLSVQIDPDVLDCSICFESLRPPLYQCQNGHVACFSCWSKLSNKCHICSRDANFARNIALEKIVESIKSSCSYAKWGCCKFINYTQRVCLRNGNLNWMFSYEIEATSRKKPENKLQLKASVTNTRQCTGLYPAEAFLLVPFDFCNSSNIALNISIERCAVV